MNTIRHITSIILWKYCRFQFQILPQNIQLYSHRITTLLPSTRPIRSFLDWGNSGTLQCDSNHDVATLPKFIIHLGTNCVNTVLTLSFLLHIPQRQSYTGAQKAWYFVWIIYPNLLQKHFVYALLRCLNRQKTTELKRKVFINKRLLTRQLKNFTGEQEHRNTRATTLAGLDSAMIQQNTEDRTQNIKTTLMRQHKTPGWDKRWEQGQLWRYDIQWKTETLEKPKK